MDFGKQITRRHSLLSLNNNKITKCTFGFNVTELQLDGDWEDFYDIEEAENNGEYLVSKKFIENINNYLI